MRASVFYNIVTRGGGAEIEELLRLLDEAGIRYCVIGGQAVNHYVEPLVSLDLDLIVATGQLAAAEELLSNRYAVRRFPHSLNVNLGVSDLRVQVQTDSRYSDFVDRAEPGDVLGIPMYVAASRDVLQVKIWAAQDSSFRPSKRQKDLTDIARLIEAYPDLGPDVPPDVLRRIEG